MSCSALFPFNTSLSPAVHRSLALKPSKCYAAPTACANVDMRAQRKPSVHVKTNEEIMADEKKFIVGTYARAPVVLWSGKGCKLYDVEGRQYLECPRPWGPRLGARRYAARRRAHACQQYLLLCSTANEAAIKFSRKFQRFSRPDDTNLPVELIAFKNCFHGRTMGAPALTSKEHYRSPFEPVMPGVTLLEYGNVQAAVERLLLYLRNQFKEKAACTVRQRNFCNPCEQHAMMLGVFSYLMRYNVA